jgi:hypothetical protein
MRFHKGGNFTNEINYGLNKIVEILVEESKEKQDKRLSTYQTNKARWKRWKP